MRTATTRGPDAAPDGPAGGPTCRKKKITIFTIPNDGHLNILRRLIGRYRDSCDFQLVFVDKRNTPPDLGDLTVPVRLLSGARGFTNTPTTRLFERVSAVLDECLDLVRARSPDLIIYDFCAVEGNLIGRATGIPYWCSIPGLMGPFLHQDYLTDSLSSAANRVAIAGIRRRFGIDVGSGDVEVISNCLHMPGELNLLWSYPSVTPRDFLRNRKTADYQFAGYLSDGYARRAGGSGRPLIYLSFGTEVMDNLWPTQRQTRAGVRRCVAGLADRWGGDDLEIVFVTQGRSVLRRYPPNWTVRDSVDQQRVLSRADVFVTHGGANSLHEALLFQVPMVVVPFFGDQVLVGRRVEELGIGVDLIRDERIDKEKARRFLDDGLAGEMDRAVRRILADKAYRRSFERIGLDSTPALAALAVAAGPPSPVERMQPTGHPAPAGVR